MLARARAALEAARASKADANGPQAATSAARSAHSAADAASGAGMSREAMVEALQAGKGPQSQPQPDAAPLDSANVGKADKDSWTDIYRVLVSSLQVSSQHFGTLTLDTVALGWLGLSRAHEGVSDDIPGTPIGLERRDTILDIITYSRWATAFDAGHTAGDIATLLSLPVADVVHYQPASRPMNPAHFIAVDAEARAICIVVRGTTTWHDAISDICGHHVPLGSGYAHSGMLECAQNLLTQHMATLEALLEMHLGFRIHCIGHSLGGGVAALLAYLLRNTPEHRARLHKAQGVVATGYGTPPVLSAELAQGCSGYVRTLVHNHDMVPRACVASLAVLQGEMERHKEEVYDNSAVAKFLRDSGVITAGRSIAQEFVTFAASSGATRYAAAAVSKNPGMQKAVAAGLSVGASFLTAEVQQMHLKAMSGDSSSNSSMAGSIPAVQARGAAVAQTPGAAAAAAATVVATPATAGAAALSDQVAGKQQQQQQRAVVEAQQQEVVLSSPGLLLYLKRSGTDAEAQYQLLQGTPGAARFKRIVLNRSMLRDHYLTHYTKALHMLLAQLQEQQHAAAAAVVAPSPAAKAVPSMSAASDLIAM